MDDDLELENGPLQHRIRILLSVGAILLVAGGGIYFAQPAYRSWKKHRFQTLALACLRQSDYRGANLFAQKILALDSTNVRACRIMASVAEAVHSPDLLKWRQRITELEPGRPGNQLDLARLAFVQGDLNQVRKALHDVNEAGRQTAAYHEMVALLAAAENQAGLSESHLVEAARLDPGNRRVQFNLAVLHLKTFDEENQEEARGQLERFSTEARFHAAALRILAQTAAFMHTNDASNALSYSSRLMADPLATFEDRLLHLTLLERLQKQEFASCLASLQQEAEKKPAKVYPLVAWMIGHDRLAEAISWINSLPPQAGQLMPVVLAKAELHAARKDWVALEALLQDSQWGEFEFARLGLLARVAHERKERPARQAFWEGAVRKAGGRLFNLEALLQIARSGRWDSEREALLEQITQRFPKEQWALNELEDIRGI